MNDAETIELVAEELDVGKRIVAGGSVRVSIRPESRTEAVDLVSHRESIKVEIVEIGREVSEKPDIRTEGNVTIIPVVEEEMVMIKRLVLKQEIRLTRTRTEETRTEQVTLRSEQVEIERLPPSPTRNQENPHD